MALPDLRFSKGDMHSLLVRQGEAASNAVRSLDPELVLSTPVQDLVERLYEQYRIEPIVLNLDNRTSSGARDVSISVPGWEGRRVEVDGTRVELFIPFSGDEVLLDVRASTWSLNPPRFGVSAKEIVVAYEGRAPLDPSQAKGSFESAVAALEQHLAWQRADIEPWNEQLRRELPSQIEARRAKVLQDRALDAFLDVPVVGHPHPSASFAVDPSRRQRSLSIASSTGATPFTPEPAISDEGFGTILAEIENVTTAVQRLPRTFAPMPEESLRDVLLVVLNNRFGPATGETFSRSGKTDIFIPWGGDNRAVFIAECKWWRGPAMFARAIEQLRGYLTWRDSHAALIVFLRAGSPSVIADKADEGLRSHQSFKRVEQRGGRITYTLASRDDARREIHLALLIIPVLR